MHVALARKYRPALFRDVVGQDMFVRILRNALSQGRLGNGLLLTGIRGVGKTTLARLVAKGLSCTQRDENQEPCNECPSCIACIQDKHVDILEMDAASHTGVEDIRQILDSCPYQPLLGPYKVYIIDEVHMLSKSAFNALLKTLEEPPAHVKFIFATTDLPKVPLTIVSRCQQLHLNRVKPSIMVPFLETIAEKEGFSIETQALSLLAQSSEGGVRDALSLLERVFVVSPPHQIITLESVHEILGLPRTEMLLTILGALEKSDVPQVLSSISTLYHNGIEPVSILNQLMRIIHEQTMSHWKSGTSQASLTMDRYDQWWQLGQKGVAELAASPFPLLALEMILLRMAYMSKFPTPSQILSIIEPLNAKTSAEKPLTGSSGAATSAYTIVDSNPTTPETIRESKPKQRPAAGFKGTISSLDQLLNALEQGREGLLHAHIRQNISWVDQAPGVLSLHWDTSRGVMPGTFTAALEKFMLEYTDQPWRIQWSHHTQQRSQIAQEEHEKAHYHDLAKQNGDVQNFLHNFPDAVIEEASPL